MSSMHYHDIFEINNVERWLSTLVDFDCHTFGCTWLREAIERYQLSTSTFGALCNRARKQMARVRRFRRRLT
jgi:hypothetical protein